MKYVILCREIHWEASAFFLGVFETKKDVHDALAKTFSKLDKDPNTYNWWFDESLSFKKLPNSPVLLVGNIDNKWNKYKIAIFNMSEKNE